MFWGKGDCGGLAGGRCVPDRGRCEVQVAASELTLARAQAAPPREGGHLESHRQPSVRHFLSDDS
ncbi:hypothetical protein E2C01_045179 [Portunus trituberculatus]|uniref:Uncharacterized protein n=1 Tax=Portunus trituberculatus TaxID=210409 RepID=A0A5B7G1A1_PORTR|nr:hypothetical protein [Portunus trituberculatus]